MANKPVTTKRRTVHAGELITITNPEEELKIVGLDIPYSEEYHFVWCPRAKEAPSSNFIRSIEEPNIVIEPIHVCKNGNSYLVIAGRLRVKAARIILAKQIANKVPEEDRLILKALVHTGDQEHLQLINIVENRKNHLNLLQQAQTYDFHLKRNGYDFELCSKILNVAEYRIRRLVKLLQCTPEVIQAFNEEQLAVDLIDDFEKLERHHQNLALEKILKKELPAHAARKVMKKIVDGEEDLENIPVDKKIGRKLFYRALAFVKNEQIVDNSYIQGAVFMMEWQLGLKQTTETSDKTFQQILEKALSYNLENDIADQFHKTPEKQFNFKELLDVIHQKYEGVTISPGQLHYTLTQMMKGNKIERDGDKYSIKKISVSEIN